MNARHLALALAAGALALSAPPAAAQSPAGEEEARAIHLLQRATYGPRPADIAEVRAIGIAAWLDRQLHPERIDDAGYERVLEWYPSATLPIRDMYSTYLIPRDRRGAMMMDDGAAMEEERRATRRSPGGGDIRGVARVIPELTMARVQRAVLSKRQLEAVLTDFWFDHFNVNGSTGQARWLVADYERSAIRPHVLGRFEDLLLATASHPAMLIYLDNMRSVAEGATLRGRQGGVNENYARELMELHTMGVEGGYTQADVEAVARAFTGWTIDLHRPAVPPGPSGDEKLDRRRQRNYERTLRDPDAGKVEFVFRPELHDIAEKTILGVTYPAGRGIEDGREVIAALAAHPATARFLATRLAQAFVADDPPPALVEELAETYLRTDGDLRAVTRALFTSERFYDPALRGAKVKTPFDLVVSALRMTDARLRAQSGGIVGFLTTAGERPYSAVPPTGYPEAGSEWMNGGALIQRAEWAAALAAGGHDGVTVNPVALTGAGDPVDGLLERFLPGVDTARLESIVRERVAGLSGGERAAAALGLILASPEFQSR